MQDGRFCRGQQLRYRRNLPEFGLLLGCRHRRWQVYGRRKIQHHLGGPKNKTIAGNPNKYFYTLRPLRHIVCETVVCDEGLTNNFPVFWS